jgi:hypothetical protein
MNGLGTERGWRGSWRGALLALSVAITSCVVSPQPSPPDPDPEIFGDGIAVNGAGTEDIADHLVFEAAAGTVVPAEGVVIATNLDTVDSPSTVAVRPDGSFSIALPGVAGDVVRFQVDQDGARSEPVDILVDATGQVADVVEDEPACLVLEPTRFVPLDGAGDERTIVVSNECVDTVRFDAPRLRRGLGPFTFSPTGTFEVAPGESGFITVRAVGEADENEDVLFLEVLEPVPTRRAITLTVPE